MSRIVCVIFSQYAIKCSSNQRPCAISVDCKTFPSPSNSKILTIVWFVLSAVFIQDNKYGIKNKDR